MLLFLFLSFFNLLFKGLVLFGALGLRVVGVLTWF